MKPWAGSILVGPINTWNIIEKERLTASGNRLRTIYSSLPGFEWNEAPAGVAAALQEIEQRMNVHFLYGVRGFGRYEHEIILVDAGAIAGETINPLQVQPVAALGPPLQPA